MGELRDEQKKFSRTAYQHAARTTSHGLEDLMITNFRLFVLRACGWNRTHAANSLGISVRSMGIFIARMIQLGIIIPDSKLDPKISGEDLRTMSKWATFVDMLSNLERSE
jgi:hypothetical protein